MFGGPEWNFHEQPGMALHLEMGVYSDLWEDQRIASWISHFQTVVPKVLSTVADGLPPEWYIGDLGLLLRKLADRLSILPELVQADGSKSWQIASKKSEDDGLRLPHSGIHDVRTPDTRDPIHRCIATSCA
jgi:hypothetical protein